MGITQPSMTTEKKTNNELDKDFECKEAFKKSQQAIFDTAASGFVDEIEERKAKRLAKNEETELCRLAEVTLSQRERRALIDERKALIKKLDHFSSGWETVQAVTRRLSQIHEKLALHDAAVQRLKSTNF